MGWQSEFDHREPDEGVTFTSRLNELREAFGEDRPIKANKDPEAVLEYLEELYEEAVEEDK